MRLKEDKETNREMNRSRLKKFEQSGIHDPGTDNDCRKDPKENPLQSQVQQTRQTPRSGTSRSRTTAHDPARGEAG